MNPKSPSTVRRAVPGDAPKLQALRQNMPYPGSILYDEESYHETALEQLRDNLRRPEELPDWRILVAEVGGEVTGYILFVVDQEHSITHQLQARILDYAVFSFDSLSALIERAARIVAAFENDYMVVQLPAGDRRIQLWFYRCGFRAEQQRSVKRIERGHRGESSPAFRVRNARPDDLPAILEVHSAYSSAYLPAGRDTDLQTLEFNFQMSYLRLDFGGDDGSRYLVMEEEASGAFVGYVFLKPGLVFNGTPSYYMYDIAVSPAFAGRALSRYLAGAAESVVGLEGGFLYGDGSLSTPVIASWHTQMGTAIESILFALDCRVWQT